MSWETGEHEERRSELEEGEIDETGAQGPEDELGTPERE